jgi:hypothetical protein
MEDFATYILEEKDYIQKMIITYYLSRKTGIFFDKSIVLRTEIAKIFMDYAMINVDQNLVLTAMLLCNCKKIDNSQKLGKLETYAKEGAEYLSTLGFNKRFCKICEELNRYSQSEPREVESDILEVVDQFTGLILNRVERPAFTTDEALVILKERNLKDANNRFLEDFILFVQNMENVNIRENIDVPVIKKLVSLHNNESNVKSFISALGNEYAPKIDEAIAKSVKSQIKEHNKNIRYTRAHRDPNRALFSKEIADRILNHESVYKIEE